MSRPKVVIIGGGFGGLAAAQKLKHAEVDVLLLDRTNHHVFQPLLYQVASAALSPGDIASPLRHILRKQKNTTVLMAEVVNIDIEKKQVYARNGDIFPYDSLIVATGARHSYFGHNTWESYAPGLKTLSDAITIRERILVAFERAERCETKEEAAKYLRFVIVGGGPTGVELAGAIAEIAHKTLLNDFRHIQPSHAEIYLIEGDSRLLTAYPEDLSARAKEDLEKLGVNIITDQHVTNITEEGAYIGDRLIETSTITWAAGNQASPPIQNSSLERDRAGRLVVEPDLSLKNHPEVFIIGDAANFKDPKTGRSLPGIAPVAVQQGHHVAETISKGLSKDERTAFHYFDKGTMATIGKAKAVAVIGKKHFTGLFAFIVWCFVHILYLINFRNRVAVMMEWFYWYISNQRGVRLIRRPIYDDPDKPTK